MANQLSDSGSTNVSSRRSKQGQKAPGGSGAQTAPKQKNGVLQVEDPIIVKPGNSLEIEFEDTFMAYVAGGHKRGHRHSQATKVTAVVILHSDGRLERTDIANNDNPTIYICYRAPRGCNCPQP